MMPILDTQRKLAQMGRIRIGDSVPSGSGRGKQPVRLEVFRLTSGNRGALEAVADRYGGVVNPWDESPKQFELITETNTIDVLVPPGEVSLDQWYEQWQGAICRVRCNGVTRQPSGDCTCDPESRACKPHTRLSVMLGNVPVAGLWRLDSTGDYAKMELPGAIEMFHLISSEIGKALLPGTLRIDYRERTIAVVRNGQEVIEKRKFTVPVLEPSAEAFAIASALGVAPPVAPLERVNADALEGRSLISEVKALESAPSAPERRSARAATPVPATGVPLPTTDDGEDDPIAPPDLVVTLGRTIASLSDQQRARVSEWRTTPGYSSANAGLTLRSLGAIMDFVSTVVTGGESPGTPEQPADAPKPPASGKASQRQIGTINKLCGDLGIDTRDRSAVHQEVELVLDARNEDGDLAPVTSLNELTKAEASKVIDALMAALDAARAQG